MTGTFVTASKLVLSIFFLGLFSACQTTSHKNFEQVRVGMDKPTILDLVGGPQRSGRIMGRDRWIYHFRSATEGDQIREIHFESGRAVYVGGRVAPNTPAEDQDRINEKVVREEAARDDEDRAAWEKEVGLLKLPERGKSQKKDDLDLRLRDSMYGTTDYHKSAREKNKVAPVFEPVQ